MDLQDLNKMDSETLDFLKSRLETQKRMKYSALLKIEENNKENSSLENVISVVDVEIKKLESAISGYQGSSHAGFTLFENSKTTLNTKTRSPKINWSELLIGTLRKHNKLMTCSEILASIFPNLEENQKSDLTMKLSSALYKLSIKGKIKKTGNIEMKNLYYGLSSWFDDDGLPFGKIQPKKEYLI